MAKISLRFLIGTVIIASVALFFLAKTALFQNIASVGAPPYIEGDLEPPDDMGSLSWLSNWVRPEGPAKVALQVGHWKSSELPDELERLRGNTGATGGGKSEWEVNMTIAEETAKLLEAKGVIVEILPATIPERYWADVFVAIHADGSTDPQTSGFKAATPRRDYTGKANTLLGYTQSEYQKATNLSIDPNVTRNMRGYYAFAWWRHVHAIHPMTVPLILETGFLTNPADRKVIVSNPELSASGLSSGIIKYLESQELL